MTLSLRPRPIVLAALLALAAAPAALAQTEAPAPAVKTVTFESKSVGRTLKYNIALPENYDESTERYPVLYLLHGYSGNYGNWARLTAPRYARAYRLIVVMPDAGNSWYANWAESDEGQKNAWEDYFVRELIPRVDETYRTVAGREGRAINGLSMGGYGALMLGLRHPDLFCSVGSHSGAIAYARQTAARLRDGNAAAPKKAARKPSDAPNPEIGIEGFSSQVERTPKGKLFANAEQADAYDPFKLVLDVPRDKLPHLYLDCGTEDNLIRSNQEFVKLLMENKIPFTYAESPGGHNGAYWTREVGHSMAVQYQILQRHLTKARAETKAAAN